MGLPAEKQYSYARDLRKMWRQAKADNYPEDNQMMSFSDYMKQQENGGGNVIKANFSQDPQGVNNRLAAFKNRSDSAKKNQDKAKSGKEPGKIKRALNEARNLKRMVNEIGLDNIKERLKKNTKEVAKKTIKRFIKKAFNKFWLVVLDILGAIFSALVSFIIAFWPFILALIVIIVIYACGCTQGKVTRFIFEKMSGVTCPVDDAAVTSSNESSVSVPSNMQAESGSVGPKKTKSFSGEAID